MLDPLAWRAHIARARQPDDRCWRGNPVGGGKSGLHANTVPANRRRGRPQGQCHRKQTAHARTLGFFPRGTPRARAKRCGKSAPRPWQQGRQGKPHREQDRIGAAVPQGTGAFPPRSPGWSREARCKARPRGMVVPHSRETWGADRTRLTGRLASSFQWGSLPRLLNETGTRAGTILSSIRIAGTRIGKRP